ncbi:MAG TPA: YdcF family protein [Polyangiaceae bacterium]|nr:YdcF family protein [Polyangiaceae bacterium]
MFFLLSKTLDLLLSPLTWAVILFALAVPWRLRARSSGRAPKTPRTTRAFGIAGIAVLVVFSSDVTEQAIFRGLESSAKDTRRPGEKYDAVIVLGGMVHERASAKGATFEYSESVERILAAYDLLRRDEARYAIVSGGGLDMDGLTVEGEVMRAQLLDWGIAPERVLLEDRALNTHENAAFVKPIVEEHGFRRLLLVTSAFHMLRSEECFHAEGLEVDTLPVDFRASAGGTYPGRFIPRAEYLADSTYALREVFGRIVYRARGYAKPIPREADAR